MMIFATRLKVGLPTSFEYFTASKMLLQYLSTFAIFASTISAACDAATRLAGAKQVIYAYNLVDPSASAAAFEKVPWGAPDAAGGCVTTM